MTDEETRAAAYRAQRAARRRAWLHNHRVTLAPASGAVAALRARWEPLRLARLERDLEEPLAPPFEIEFEDPPLPRDHVARRR